MVDVEVKNINLQPVAAPSYYVYVGVRAKGPKVCIYFKRAS